MNDDNRLEQVQKKEKQNIVIPLIIILIPISIVFYIYISNHIKIVNKCKEMVRYVPATEYHDEYFSYYATLTTNKFESREAAEDACVRKKKNAENEK
ncbi:MAG: hypothetical protein KAS07_03020 [Candidatus Pacebacteria bacterium]|nr:hypothetical protein [Candidatus Paceibacterota bacterium]